MFSVGKRFIRSISTLKKNQASASEQEEIDHLQSPRQKIDVERTLLQSPKDLSAANVHKGSMRLFFTGGLNKKVNKNATSTTTTASHIKDIFDINNEVLAEKKSKNRPSNVFNFHIIPYYYSWIIQIKEILYKH